MDWNSKTPVRWDWENLVLLGGKKSELRKPARQHEWMVEGAAGGIGNGTLYSSGSGACSGSELFNDSSKSSISFSMDSSSKAAAMEVPDFNFEAAEGFPRNLSKSKELAMVEDTGTSPVAGAKFGRGDPPIGSASFVNSVAGSMACLSSIRKNEAAANVYLIIMHADANPSQKLSHSILHGFLHHFMSEGSSYKSSACPSKYPKKKLFSLLDFKTSHQPGKQALPIAKRWFASPDDRQHVNFLLSRAPFDHMQTIPSSAWEGSSGFKLTQTKESWIKSTKAGGIGRMLHLPGSELSNNVSTLHQGLGRLLPFKGNTAEVLSQGLGASLVASNLNGAPDFRRALSLLSTDSWRLAKPGTTSDNQFASTDNTTAAHPVMHAVDMSSGFWQNEQTLAQDTRVLPADLHSRTSKFQEFQLLKTPYEAAPSGSSQTH